MSFLVNAGRLDFSANLIHFPILSVIVCIIIPSLHCHMYSNPNNSGRFESTTSFVDALLWFHPEPIGSSALRCHYGMQHHHRRSACAITSQLTSLLRLVPPCHAHMCTDVTKNVIARGSLLPSWVSCGITAREFLLFFFTRMLRETTAFTWCSIGMRIEADGI